MSKERILSAIDVGSIKIATLIASFSEEEQIRIIGVSSVPSRGIKKGMVVDIDEAVEGISQSLTAAERMAGLAVSSAFVVVNGQQISSINSTGVVAVADPKGEITTSDVERVTEAARAVSLPSSREIIHVIPRFFIVDSQEGVADPIGMSGVRLEASAHIITGAVSTNRNLVKCINQVGVDVESLVFGGLASAYATLSDTEKELGVALIDLGGGTTDLALFVEGSPTFCAVLPLGGKNITSDIAIGLRLSLEDAEKVKIFISQYKPKVLPVGKMAESDEVDISDLKVGELKTLDRKFIRDGIIKPRLEEIFEQVGQTIQKSGLSHQLPAGVVLCGGASLTLGASDVAKRILRLPVRLATPVGVAGLIDEVCNPAFAASVGSIIFGSKLTAERKSALSLPQLPKAIEKIKKVIGWVRSYLP